MCVKINNVDGYSPR